MGHRLFPNTDSWRLGRRRTGYLAARCSLPFLLLFLTACAENGASILNASGPAAARINTLWWIMFATGVVVYLVVMGYLLAGLFRRRPPGPAEANTTNEGTSIVMWGGAILPAVIILAIFGATVYTMAALDEPANASELTIEVEGRQWWWEVRYPELGIRTANEIHIPAGRPVAVKLLSRDVIHSFWVPELHGKLDMIPGKVTEFWLQASEPGTYLGICAEFCGVQHAKMQFLVVAQEEEQFLSWATQQRQPAPEPVGELALSGRDIFLASSCIDCHAVRGTNATGELGPDLTHLASRRTLGAAAVPNNRGNLAGWIMDPHSIKPGALMPPSELSGSELQALLAYLQALE